MEYTDEFYTKHFEMLAAFKATLISAEERMVLEEATVYDFIKVRYKEWLLQTDLSTSSRNARLRMLDKLIDNLVAYVDSTMQGGA